MAGMDAGPGTGLGGLGWFLGVWVVMMAAMMLPSAAPMVAQYATMTRRRSAVLPSLFIAGYLIVWGAAGAAAYGVFALGRDLAGGDFAWQAGGRWLAAGALGVAALYEVTPLKEACLRRCRSPLGFLVGAWRDGASGAVEMGARHAAWCLGCCWGLMVALFALGVMSIAWMVLVAALIGLEKTLPWRMVATWGSAAVLLALGAGIAVSPRDVPGLVVPAGGHRQPVDMRMSQ